MAFINNVTQFSFSEAMVLLGAHLVISFSTFLQKKNIYIHNTFPSRSFKKIILVEHFCICLNIYRKQIYSKNHIQYQTSI